MPTNLSPAQIGQKLKAKYPGSYDHLTDEDAGQRLINKYPEAYGPEVAAHPAADVHAPGVQDTVNYLFPEVDPSQGVTNVGNRAIRSLTSQVTELPGRIRNIKPYVPEGDAATDKVAKQLHLGQQDVAPSTQDSPVPGYVATAKTKGMQQAGEDVLGDALAAYAGGKAMEAAPEAAATTLNAVGRGMRKAGSLSSRLGVGKVTGPHDIEGDIGAGISQNRVVGVTPRGINRKLTARLDPAMQARDAILARSQAAPTDVAPIVDSAFTSVTAPKTNIKTGAAQPGSISHATTSRRAIQEIQDPYTGRPSGIPKDSNLSPLEMSQLQRNVYEMTDYVTPEGDLSNRALKGTGAGLKDAINAAAPEASTMTDHIHNTLEARDYTKSIPDPAEAHGFGQLGIRAAKMARTGVGTAAGAALDMGGSLLQRMGGAVRRAGGSPVAPTAPSTGPGGPPAAGATPTGLPASTVPLPGGRQLPQTAAPQTTPPSPVAPALPEAAGQGIPVTGVNPGPPNPATARTRIAPRVSTPRPQPVLTDQPGFTPPQGSRRIIATPDGLQPEPYPLGPGPQRPALDTPAGNRRSMVQQLRDQTQRAADAREAELQASAEKVASQPVRTTPEHPEPNPAKVAGGKVRAARAAIHGKNGVVQSGGMAPRPTLTEQLNMDPSKVEEGDYSLTQPVTIYKGATGSSKRSIKEVGFDPEFGGGRVHAGTDPDVAYEYTDAAQGTGKDNKVFTTTLPAKTPVGSYTNGQIADPGPYWESGVVAVRKPVPPEAIQRMTPPAAKPKLSQKVKVSPEELAKLNRDPAGVRKGDFSPTEPYVYYHGTKASLADKIRREGVTSAEGHSAWTSTDPDIARVAAIGEFTKKGLGSREGAIIKGEVPASKVRLASDEDYDLADDGKGYSEHFPYMKSDGEFQSLTGKHFPPETIKDVEFIDKKGNPKPAKPAPAPAPGGKLADKVASRSTGPDRPAHAPLRLPDPTDIDGWENLVDIGFAKYNTKTHQFDYIGPTGGRK